MAARCSEDPPSLSRVGIATTVVVVNYVRRGAGARHVGETPTRAPRPAEPNPVMPKARNSWAACRLRTSGRKTQVSRAGESLGGIRPISGEP